MGLVLGRFWSYMTPDYIYSEMTWEEIALSLQYVNRYEELKTPEYKGKTSIHDWVSPPKSIAGLRDIARKIKGGK